MMLSAFNLERHLIMWALVRLRLRKLRKREVKLRPKEEKIISHLGPFLMISDCYMLPVIYAFS